VLHLDAANVKSYPGSGTAWNDLSGLGNNGTLLAGVSHDSINKTFVFNGTNSACTHTGAPLTGNPTFSVTGFFYITGATVGKATWGIGGNTTGQGINSYSLNGTNLISMDLWGQTTIQSSQVYDLNAWTFCAWVYRGPVYSRANISLYKNGIEYTGSNLSVARGAETNTPAINSSGIVIGRAGTTDGNYMAPVKIPAINFYNRALSATEINQNFEALRGRYGI
jgi:hypothetical protein